MPLSDPIDHPPSRRWPLIRRWALGVYAVLLAASWVWVAVRPHASASAPPETPAGAVRLSTEVVLDGRRVGISALRWGGGAGARAEGSVPVILLHGGPGQGANFAGLGPMTARAGREVYAVDLPGFGASERIVPDYSILAGARAVLAWMDEVRIGRAHVLGWSQGGGVALHIADLAPERAASLTLLASIGPQETEGARSYAFEWWRAGAADLGRRVVPWLVPHFGLFPAAPPAFTRFFTDTDQRPLRGVMGRIAGRGTPTLIVQGRRDFLVPHWSAAEYARAMPGGRTAVLMLRGSHFVPWWTEEARADLAGRLGAFWSRHDEPGAEAAGGVTDLAPVPRLFGRFGAIVAERIVAAPWWVVAGAIALLAARRGPSSRWTVALAGLLVVTALADYAVAWVGLSVGAWVWLARGMRRARREDWAPAHVEEWRERFGRGPFWATGLGLLRPDLRAEVPAALRVVPPRWAGLRVLMVAGAMLTLSARHLTLLVAALLAAAPIMLDPFHPLGELGVVLGLVAARVAVGVLDRVMTIPGRRLIRASLARAVRFEFWPAAAVYAGLAPDFIRWWRKAGHPLAFTACNPGIENGGGLVGESKLAIMAALRRDAVRAGLDGALVAACCPTWSVGAGEVEGRAARVEEIVREQGLAWPVVLKPDSGYRGFAVRVVRSRAEAARYFRMMPAAVLVQPWHAGPGEIGVVWVRELAGAAEGGTEGGAAGRIFSITAKQFASLDGDGRRTVEELIDRHPRFRLQGPTFLARLAGRRLEVLGRGERLPIALAGNHCQGTLFRDGAGMITPGLERAVDSLCAAYRGNAAAAEGGLDMARLDIRYASEERLLAGELEPGSVIELNGTLGESTNIYDPGKPVSWSYGVLRAQWAALYALGRARMDEGHPPLSVGAFLGLLWGHYRGRRGSALAD